MGNGLKVNLNSRWANYPHVQADLTVIQFRVFTQLLDFTIVMCSLGWRI
jgi:hypothetical protein